ncbi:hypothetical protein ACEPPN_011318 [Leptodophora sp. 'Broadleaf-Isolate-01']
MNFVPNGRKTQEEWLQMQNDYAEARAKKLATLYKAEILHDIEMLKKPWTDDNGGPSTDNDPFHPEAKANLALANGNQTTQEHTLGWLEQYASTYLDPDEYSLINELVNSGDLFKIRHLRSWKDDLVPETPQLRELVRLADTKGTGADDHNQPWNRIWESYTLLQRLRVLRRFADGRNLTVSEAPLPDGSNFEASNHFLTATWILHRCYIRLLHQRSLYVGRDNIGERMLEKILVLSLAYLSLELDKVSHDPESEQQNLPAFADIYFLYQQLSRAVNGIADGVQFETRPGFYSKEDTVSFNTSPARMAEIVDMVLSSKSTSLYLTNADGHAELTAGTRTMAFVVRPSRTG